MATTSIPQTGPVGRSLAAFGVENFGKLYAAGFVWSMCRWAIGFMGAFVVNDLSDSPRLVQLTGTAMWAPLLIAGVAGGAISDRFDRRNTLLVMFAALIPLTVVIGLLAAAGELRVWMVYPYMVTIGCGWVMDMTARRSLIHDVVGDAHLNGAMALEQFSSASGLALGALAGGSFIGLFGVSWAYLAIAIAMSVSMLIINRVPKIAVKDASAPPAASESFASSVANGFRALPANPRLLSILGVTLIVNVFHFSYFPIVQVIGDRVGASPAATGLLAAATGFGMALGSLFVMTARPRRGRAYIRGSFVAMVLVLGFGFFTSYSLVFASLFLASIGIGLFGANQSALVLSSAPEEIRGRAMGLLTMAIGGLPVGMYLLGEAAERLGAPTALIASNLMGIAVLVLWLRFRPEVLSVS